MSKRYKPKQTITSTTTTSTTTSTTSTTKHTKKVYTPFPPPQLPSKIDLQIESGEYFINQQIRENNKKQEKMMASKKKSEERKLTRGMLYCMLYCVYT